MLSIPHFVSISLTIKVNGSLSNFVTPEINNFRAEIAAL